MKSLRYFLLTLFLCVGCNALLAQKVITFKELISISPYVQDYSDGEFYGYKFQDVPIVVKTLSKYRYVFDGNEFVPGAGVFSTYSSPSSVISLTGVSVSIIVYNINEYKKFLNQIVNSGFKKRNRSGYGSYYTNGRLDVEISTSRQNYTFDISNHLNIW